ncbi:MAG: DUF3592 domain-containing protein [Richelia sp. RM2_1_2]|nr:DUF3592 domain-containing protein [Richelia sp. SM2_1_7]NJO62605.1 DUF3592 domain-containing protein [Richelia sp. RM2_1_2]
MNPVQKVNQVEIFCMGVLQFVFASVGGGLLVQFPSYYQSEVRFEANAVSATGNVIKTREEVEYSGGGIVPLSSRTKYISTIEFQTNQGKSVEFTTSSACSRQQDCENKTVQVRYDPSVPTQARIDSNISFNVRVWSYGVLSLILFLIGIRPLLINLSNVPTQSKTN